MRLKSSSPELNDRHVIVKEIQRAPVSGNFLHADLYEVDLDRRRSASRCHCASPAKPTAWPRAASWRPLVREVEVECLPLEIPDVVEVDVTALDIHDVIHISAMTFPGNVKPIFDTDYPVVTVLPPTVAEAPVAVAAEAAPVEGAEAAEGAAAAPAAAEAGAKEGAKGGAKEAAAEKGGGKKG